MSAWKSCCIVLATSLLSLPAIAFGASHPTYSETLERFSLERPSTGLSGPGVAETLEFDAFGRRFAIELETNRRLLGALQRRDLGTGVELYRGRIAATAGSWARLVIADGLPRGLVFDGREIYGIEVQAGTTAPVIFRLADLSIEPGTLSCGATPVAVSGDDLLKATGADIARATAGPGAVSQLDMAIIADFEFASDNGANAQVAMVTRMSNVDGIFSEQLGVQLNVNRVDIFDTAADPFSDETDAGNLLGELADYRQATPAQNGNGLTHLFTGRSLDGSTVGIAFRGALCRTRSGAGLTQATNGTTFDSLVAAHEIGHNFGAGHDGESGSACEATPTTFLMAPNLNGSDEFSDCSIASMTDDIERASCITPLPSTDIAVVAGPGPATVLLGDAATITFEVNGIGTETADDVSLGISVPAGVTLDSVTPTAGSCSTGAGSADCQLGSVSAGTGVTVSLAVTTSDVGLQEFAAIGSAAVDANANNNDASVSFTIDPATDLAVLAPGLAQLGLDETATVRPTIDNRSIIAATDVVVTITPTTGLRVDSAAWAAGSCTVDAAGATCTATSLAADSANAIDVELTGTVDGGQSYTVEAAAAETDRNAGNNQATGTVTVGDAPAPPAPGAGDDGGGAGGTGGQGLLLLALFAGLRQRRNQMHEIN